MIREGEVFVKNKTKVASEMGFVERGVVCSRKLLFKSSEKKFSFRSAESRFAVNRQPIDLL